MKFRIHILNKLQFQLLFLLALLFCIFSFAVFQQNVNQNKQISILFTKQAIDKKAIFNKLLSLKGAQLEAFVYDYTFWDDMVNFVESQDTEWAKINIVESLTSFKSDEAWVYKTDGSCIYSATKDGAHNSKTFPVADQFVPGLFLNGRFCHFYANTDKGLLEIQGATIHPSGDSERKTDPKGFFFVGKMWDQKYIDDFAILMNGKITILNPAENPNPVDAINRHSAEIVFFTELPSWDKLPAGYIRTKLTSFIIMESNRMAERETVSLALFLIFIFLGIAFFVIFRVVLPLAMITKTLRDENIKHIMRFVGNDKSEIGEIAGLIKTFFAQRDNLLKEIKERKQTERALKERHAELQNTQKQLMLSEKMAAMGQLVAGIAHEINNPIGFVGSNLSTLEKYIESVTQVFRAAQVLKAAVYEGNIEKSQKTVQHISELEENIGISYALNDIENLIRESKEGIRRVTKIMKDLKKFSEADMEIKSGCDLNLILEGATNIVWNELKYKAEVKKEYGKLPLIRCNEQQLGQVFINLLVNAAQAILEPGVITVRSYANDDKVCVDITDTGIGISPENITKIFEPFFTTKEIGKGTGLGLSVSYEIIRMHGGEILVKSEVNKGTTFTVVLPINPSLRSDGNV